MKKVFMSIGSVLALAFVMILFINASPDGPDKNKKAKSAAKTETVQSHSTTTCNPANCANGAACDPKKCSEKGCTHEKGVCDPTKCAAKGCIHENGTCDPTTCKGHEGMTCKEGKTCDHTAGTCQGKK